MNRYEINTNEKNNRDEFEENIDQIRQIMKGMNIPNEFEKSRKLLNNYSKEEIAENTKFFLYSYDSNSGDLYIGSGVCRYFTTRVIVIESIEYISSNNIREKIKIQEDMNTKEIQGETGLSGEIVRGLTGTEYHSINPQLETQGETDSQEEIEVQGETGVQGIQGQTEITGKTRISIKKFILFLLRGTRSQREKRFLSIMEVAVLFLIVLILMIAFLLK